MKKAIRVVGFALLMTLVLLLAYRVFKWKDTSGDYISSITQLKNTPDNSIDVFFVGSSHVYNGVAPHVLWKNHGIAAFDVSISAMDMNSSYYYTKYALKKQSPKLICVDLFSLTYDEHAILANEYRNYITMPDAKLQYELVNAFTDDKEKKKNYLLRWPIIHTRYKELKQGDFIDTGFTVFGRGEHIESITSFQNAANYRQNLDITDMAELSDKQKNAIDKFLELGKQKNASILFFLTPYEMSVEEMKVYNAIEKYIEGKDNAYFVLCAKDESLDISKDFDFLNYGHLNYAGAIKFSAWMGEYISEHFAMEKHAGDPKYSLWDEDLLYYNVEATNVEVSNLINSGCTPQELIEELKKHSYLTYIISMNADYAECEAGQIIYNSLLVPPEGRTSDTVLIVSGEDFEMVKATDDPVFIELNRYTGIKIKRNESADLNEFYINDAPYDARKKGITIVVYDTYNKRILGSFQ